MSKSLDFKTLVDLFDQNARRLPKKVGLIFEDQSFSYQEMDKRVGKIANYIISHTQEGDIVALLLHNSPEFIFSYLGIMRAGCTVLLLPANISDSSLDFQLTKTRPRLIVSEIGYQTKIRRCPVASKLTSVLASEIAATNDKMGRRTVDENDVSTIIFTSGTTSEPKGVRLEHRNVVQATKNIIEFLGFNQDDIDLNCSALSHSFGLGHIHCLLAVGGTIVLFRDSVNLKKILADLARYKVTTFGAVPAILRLVCANYPEEFTKSGQSLRFVQTNTSLLEPELIEKILRLLPRSDFNYYYGLSEASRSTFINFRRNLEKRDSVGQASPNVKVKILDENDMAVPPLQVGEICIAGKHVIKEYWNNPIASKKIRGGYLHTGDAGYLDHDGFLYFKGRTDDVINVAGEKVMPEEIEAVAKSLSGIIEAAAVATPDRLLGEAVKLYVVVSKETIISKEEIISLCQSKLERFKVPRVVEEIEELPKTENGKIQRKKLRELNFNG